MESDSDSSCGLEMTSSRLERQEQRRQQYENRVADPIFSSTGQLNKWQYRLIFLLILIRMPIVLMETINKIMQITFNHQNLLSMNYYENYSQNNNSSSSSIEYYNNHYEKIISTFGICFGYLFFGISGDIRGRKPSLAVAIFIQIFSSLLSSLIPWYWLFCLSYLTMNFANGGILILTYVLCMEFIEPKKRKIITFIFLLPNGFSYLFFIFSINWLHTIENLNIFIILYSSILIVFLLYIIPESPEWFFMIGSVNRLTNILMNAAIINGLSYEHIFDVITEAQKRKKLQKLSISSFTITSTEVQNNTSTSLSSLSSKRKRLKYIIKLFCGDNNDSKIRNQFIFIIFNWICFYVCMNEIIFMNNLMIFLNNFLIIQIVIISCSIITGLLLCYPFLKYLGYKISIILIYFIITLSMLTITFLPATRNNNNNNNIMKLLKIVIFSIVIIVTSTLHTILHVCTVNLFPINIRCIIIGVSNAIGQIIQIIFYFIFLFVYTTYSYNKQSHSLINEYYWIRPCICGIISFICAIINLCQYQRTKNQCNDELSSAKCNNNNNKEFNERIEVN